MEYRIKYTVERGVAEFQKSCQDFETFPQPGRQIVSWSAGSWSKTIDSLTVNLKSNLTGNSDFLVLIPNRATSSSDVTETDGDISLHQKNMTPKSLETFAVYATLHTGESCDGIQMCYAVYSSDQSISNDTFGMYGLILAVVILSSFAMLMKYVWICIRIAKKVRGEEDGFDDGSSTGETVNYSEGVTKTATEGGGGYGKNGGGYDEKPSVVVSSMQGVVSRLNP